MKWPIRCCLAFALLAQALPAAVKIDLSRVTPVPARQKIPTQDFFRPRALAQPILNRAGTHIAALMAAGEDKHLLLVYDIATTKAESLAYRGERDIYNVYWLSNSVVLFQLSSRKMYGLGILAADINNLTKAYPLQQYSGSSLLSVPLANPLQPLIWNRRDLDTQRDVGIVAVDSGARNATVVDLTVAMNDFEYVARRTKVLENNSRNILRTYPPPPGPGLTYRYMADNQGELAYAFTSAEGELSMFRLTDGKWVRCPVDLEQVAIVGCDTAPGQLLAIGPSVDDRPNPLQLLDASTGKLGAIVLEDPLYDFNGWTYNDPATGDVLGVVFRKATQQSYWFNSRFKSLQKSLEGMFPRQIVRIISSNDLNTIFLVATYSDREPVAYHWVNLAARKAGLFKNSAPWIDPTRMRPTEVVQFKTRDGHQLDGYLTLPAGASKEQPPPLVVLCHGGPWARDDWGFNGEVQFLAHHGYAVLQPNYRGSTGSVGRFAAGDEYAFVKMHHDVTDAVKTVVGSGWVDKDRVGIMGASFGGYLAVSGVAHEADLYRCAVTNAGVFDWALQLQAEKSDRYENTTYGRLVRVLGDPKQEVEKYDAMSPLRHVAKIRAPVFVAGGKDDDVVELQQSKNLLAELDQRGIPNEKLFIGGEGHGMAYLEHDVVYYDRVLAFLDKHLMSRR